MSTCEHCGRCHGDEAYDGAVMGSDYEPCACLRCPECDQVREGDERVLDGLKCLDCAYGNAPEKGDD